MRFLEDSAMGNPMPVALSEILFIELYSHWFLLLYHAQIVSINFENSSGWVTHMILLQFAIFAIFAISNIDIGIRPHEMHTPSHQVEHISWPS